VAELLDGGRLEPCLLPHLPQGGVLGGLALLRVPLRQREDVVAHAHDGEVRPAAHVADHEPARRELADHSSVTNGTKRTPVTASSSPSRKRIRSSWPPRSTGQTSAAPGSSCSSRAAGGRSCAVAVTEIPPNGARSGAPWEPSPTPTTTLSYPSSCSACSARTARVSWRSIVTTSRHSRDST